MRTQRGGGSERGNGDAPLRAQYVNRRADVEAAVKLGLTEDEYEHIKRIQEREPTYVELAIYSLMWSEHCSYKHSRPILGRFPTSGPRILQGPGENAGIIDVGDGWAVAMKVESHNHPSAVEPFQGAATGVGGIVRDIFTMGARPCVSMDSLRFGELTEPRQRFLLDGVVGGIAHYGNCLGIPTIGGEIYFEPSYEGNCLVNAMSAGLIRTDGIVRAIASGVGNHVVLIGSKTGRDGIGGASVLASQEFDETLEEKRPSVQVGDPFTEKKLIEACLELIHRKLVVSMQDLGAAGLTSSSSEMSSKGFVGLDIHADRVPLREADMEPWEIMISESQERMLAIVTEEQLADVREVCERWDLDCTVIGEVTDSKMLRIYWHGERVADIPARRLADESPVIRTPSVKPGYLVDDPVAVDDGSYPQPQDLGAALTQLLAAPNIASKRWAWEQYDYIVQANTVQIPGSDAAVLRIKDTPRGFAFSNDCNGRHCYLDPYRGSKAAVAEAARNLSCAGALPVAVTDCLNFGNPEKGEIYWQFEQSVEGIAEACEALDTPVVSGNVSFYNESFGQAIYPTPMIGMLGIYDDVSIHLDDAFKDEGDVIVVLGPEAGWMDGSEYQKIAYGKVAGRVPDVDLQVEVELQAKVRAAVAARLLKSAHDCAEGGLAVALAECAIASGSDGGAVYADPDSPARVAGRGRWLGADVDLGPAAAVAGAAGRPDLALFGEAPSRIVVSVAPDKLAALEELLGELPRRVAGRVTKADLRCTMEGEELFAVPVSELHSAYESLPQRLA
ncbi:MAG TPA: phosphoribosylformylglycinamidine synthase subunit PurL [Thermoleophilia bacterium]|nr:phosphoribosylformylglycinamidine synthase subunit PurL [Thermoleophilia bacterium]